MKENWVKIYEVEDYENTNKPIWLEQILTEDNIPYKNEIEEYWIGIRIPKYKKRFNIFVPKEHKKTVKKYIEEFEDSKSIIKDNIEEFKDIDEAQNDKEIKKYNKIKKIGFIFWIAFLFIVIILVIIGVIITNM